MPFFKKVLQCFHFKFFLLFLSVLLTTLCFAQQTVTGKVTDNNTTQGLAGINVVVKGTTRGTITDANGNFSIVASPGEVLEITAINYTPQEITVGTTTSLSNIVLASRNAQTLSVKGAEALSKCRVGKTTHLTGPTGLWSPRSHGFSGMYC